MFTWKLQKRFVADSRMTVFRNLFLGKRCFILGNGPSLTLEDIERLRWEYTFASNKIYLCFSQTSWRPSFYMVEDLLVLKQNVDRLENLTGTTCFYPHFFRKTLGESHNRIYIRALPAEYTESPLRDPDFPRFSNDAVQGLFWGSTVIYSQIQLAVFMGFREIYLLGVDHHYILPQKKIENYYIAEGERNHFHPDYRKPGEKWYQPQPEVMERSYAHALAACRQLGVKLGNASRRTCLEIIPRLSLEEALLPPERRNLSIAPNS